MIVVYFRVIHKQTLSAISVQFMMFWFGSVGNWMLALGLSAKALVICFDTEAEGMGSVSVIISLTAPPSGFSSSFLSLGSVLAFVVNHFAIFASASVDRSDFLLETSVLESKSTKESTKFKQSEIL